LDCEAKSVRKIWARGRGPPQPKTGGGRGQDIFGIKSEDPCPNSVRDRKKKGGKPVTKPGQGSQEGHLRDRQSIHHVGRKRCKGCC